MKAVHSMQYILSETDINVENHHLIYVLFCVPLEIFVLFNLKPT